MRYILADVAEQISERENNPSTSAFDKFIGLEHYESGKAVIEKYGITSNLDSAMKIARAGDILVARRNVYLRRAALTKFDALTSGDSIVLRVKDKSLARILPFVLNTDDFWDYADQHSDGSMSKRLSPKMLLNYSFSIRDDLDLDLVSEMLWTAEDTLQAYNKLLVETDNMVKARFVEMFGNPEENPMNWPIRTFSDVAVIDGKMTTDYEKYADYPHIGIDSIEKGTGALSGYRTVREDNVISSKYVFGPSHILYSKIRPVLNKVALPNFEGLCSADCYPILVNETICRKKFFAHVMRSDFFLKYVLSLSARSQMPKVNRTQLAGFKFPCPPVEKQDEYVLLIEQSDESKLALKDAIAALKATKKSIMRDAFDC